MRGAVVLDITPSRGYVLTTLDTQVALLSDPQVILLIVFLAEERLVVVASLLWTTP